jgi:hypothetical protein
MGTATAGIEPTSRRSRTSMTRPTLNKGATLFVTCLFRPSGFQPTDAWHGTPGEGEPVDLTDSTPVRILFTIRWLATTATVVRYFITVVRNSDICGKAISRVMMITSQPRNQ